MRNYRAEMYRLISSITQEQYEAAWDDLHSLELQIKLMEDRQRWMHSVSLEDSRVFMQLVADSCKELDKNFAALEEEYATTLV